MISTPLRTQDHTPPTVATSPRWPGLLAVPAAGLVFELVMLKAASANPYRSPDFGELKLWTWIALPFLLTGVLMVVAAGRGRIAWGLGVGLAVAIGLGGVWGCLDAHDRLDASLIVLSGPLVQLAVVAAVGLVIWLISSGTPASRK